MDWVNKGDTWGYETKLGLNYAFTKDTSAKLGYYYFYAKAEDMDEEGNYGSYSDNTDLRYVQRGYYFGLDHKL